MKVEEFFEEMLKRIEKKKEKFGDGWKTTSIKRLEGRLHREYGEYIDPRIASSKGKRRLVDLIDIANQAMFIWLRRKEEDNKDDYFDYDKDHIDLEDRT